MARYSVELNEGRMDMGALGRANVTRMVRVDAPSQAEAMAEARAEHGDRVMRCSLMRQFTVKLASKKDKRRRPEYVTTAANAHDAVRNVGYISTVWRATGYSLTGSSKQWPEAVLAVTDTTPEAELGGAPRLQPTNGTELREQQLAAMQAAEARRRRRRR